MLKRLFSIEDFFDIGERYGIDYHFPQLSSCRERAKEKRIVVQGDVEEMTLSSGICLTNSNVRVLQPYESTSLHCCPFYTLVVLEGCVALRLNGKEFVVRSGMAFSTRLGDPLVMNASHLADCHLRTVSLGIFPTTFALDPLLGSLLNEWEQGGNPTFLWQVPGYLLSGLQHALENTVPGLSRQLMLEGVMLQLLGQGLSFGQRGGERRVLPPPGEQDRLENVRRLLAQQPEKEYTLNELAQMAAMSTSSLRTKFRQAYGHSVFDYLRDCRLELARRYLVQGYSVQQAAWMSGYQHATNFATAFRRRYGMAPSDVRMVS
ncbi:helix-turn-helix transcriptional regulator [Pectobacterium versatile]|uniref:helix-turn-helix transcriptional regulator n=1 Tax=Pectobacterium versatile TaxID=2488639 RepID=UPI0038029A41